MTSRNKDVEEVHLMLRALCKDKVAEKEKRKEEARVQRVRDRIVSGEQWKDFVVQPKGFVRQEKEKEQPIDQEKPVEEEKKKEKKEKKEKKVPKVGFWFRTDTASRKKRRKIELDFFNRTTKQKSSTKRPGKIERLLKKEVSKLGRDFCPEGECYLIGGSSVGRKVKGKASFKTSQAGV